MYENGYLNQCILSGFFLTESPIPKHFWKIEILTYSRVVNVQVELNKRAIKHF